MAWIYFVSYASADGYGNCEIPLDREIKSIKDVKSISHTLEKFAGECVAVLNFTLLRREPRQ